MLKNLTIKQKLIFLSVLTISVILLFSLKLSYDTFNSYKNTKDTASLIELSVKMSAVLHELQKERGTSAGFLGSKGVKFSDALPRQHSSTDAKISELNTYIKNHPSQYTQKVTKDIDLNSILSMRTKVKSQTLPVSGAVKFYTAINKNIIDLASNFSTVPKNQELRTNFNSLVIFISSKERAGIERAVLSSVFSKDKFTRATAAKFQSLVSEQKAITNLFVQTANSDMQKAYHETESDNSFAEVDLYRKIAMQNN